MSTPKYLKKQGDPDHIYHVFTKGLAERGDMEPFVPKGEVKQAVKLDVPEMSADERLLTVKAAVLTIPVEQYGKAGFGRPAMPKVKDISEIVGFDATVDEVVAAMAVKETA